MKLNLTASSGEVPVGPMVPMVPIVSVVSVI